MSTIYSSDKKKDDSAAYALGAGLGVLALAFGLFCGLAGLLVATLGVPFWGAVVVMFAAYVVIRMGTYRAPR